MSAPRSAPPAGAPALPLWSDAAVFSAAFLQLPAVPPWAVSAPPRWPYLAHGPPGLADALLAPPPWPPRRHPLGPFEVAAALRVHHARAAAQAEAHAAAAAAQPPAAPAATQPARPGAARVYSRQQLLALKPALTPRPPELKGHPAALDDAPPAKAAPPVPAAAPKSAAAPPAPPPTPAAPPGPRRYAATALLRLRHAVATPPSPAVLSAASALEGVTQLAATAAPPAAASRAGAPAPSTAVAAPLPPLLTPCGLWSEAEPPAGASWADPAFLEDLAALPSAAAALDPPAPPSASALRFAPEAALPAFCARACAEADADARDDEGLRWALMRGEAALPGRPALVTAMQLLPRSADASTALAVLCGADAADAVGWAAVAIGTGAFLPAAARAAFAARPPGLPAGRDAPAALFACLDALRGAHGPPCLEVFDLRSGAPLAFQIQHA